MIDSAGLTTLVRYFTGLVISPIPDVAWISEVVILPVTRHASRARLPFWDIGGTSEIGDFTQLISLTDIVTAVG